MNYKNKKLLNLILNTVIPLFVGLTIYVFMKNGTYINSFLMLDFHYNPKTVVGRFIVNWFCDFLWSYALVFALYVVLSPFKNKLLYSFITSTILGIVLEFLQKSNVLPGTFDWWDIVVECLAVFIATSFIKMIEKKDGSV